MDPSGEGAWDRCGCAGAGACGCAGGLEGGEGETGGGEGTNTPQDKSGFARARAFALPRPVASRMPRFARSRSATTRTCSHKTVCDVTTGPASLPVSGGRAMAHETLLA